jgi:hypothetical protein
MVCVCDVIPTGSPITVATFAHHIGQFSNVFLIVSHFSVPATRISHAEIYFPCSLCKSDSRCTSSNTQLWRIGDGDIQGSNVMIIGVVKSLPNDLGVPILQLARQPSADHIRTSEVKSQRIDWDAIFKLAT